MLPSLALDDRSRYRPTGRPALVAGLAVLLLSAAALWWAKWVPYEARIAGLSSSHTWKGSSILSVGGVRSGDAPSWSAATSFTRTYLLAIWKALVAAVLISAAVQALLPRAWLLRLLNHRRAITSAALGGLMSTPSMMCACCTAPVASTLRRDGVSRAAAIAYWLGNPLLNPAVLAFLAFVAPWQWTVTRLVVGLLVVVLGSALVARLTDGGQPAVEQVTDGEERGSAPWLAGAPARFVRALMRIAVTLLPEYLVVVLAIGAVRGWLLDLGTGDLRSGGLVVLLAAVIGTLMVIPTAGEIPILQGLAVAGLSTGGVGALLLTLPAVSLPGAAMVARSFGWRATVGTAGVVVAGGLVAGGLLTVL